MGVKINELYYDATDGVYYARNDKGDWFEVDLLVMDAGDVEPKELELVWKRDFGAELAPLKDGSVVKIKDGLVFERFRGAWFTPGGATEYSDSDVASYGDGDILLEVK